MSGFTADNKKDWSSKKSRKMGSLKSSKLFRRLLKKLVSSTVPVESLQSHPQGYVTQPGDQLEEKIKGDKAHHSKAPL